MMMMRMMILSKNTLKRLWACDCESSLLFCTNDRNNEKKFFKYIKLTDPHDHLNFQVLMYWKDWNTHSCKIPLLSFQRSFFIHPNISLFYRVISLFYRELSFILLFPPFEVDCSSFYLISCCFVEDCQKSPKPGICRGSSSDETNEIVNFGTLKLNFKWSQQNAALPASKEDGK